MQVFLDRESVSVKVAAILPRPHPAVMFRQVSEGAVLLHMEEEIYFGLNSVGAVLWELLPPVCADLEGLCARLSERYPDVDAEILRQDAVELLADLERGKLVVTPE